MKTKLFKISLLFLLFALARVATPAQTDTQTVDSLIQDLSSSNPEAIARAGSKLAELKEAAIPKLFAFIHDENDKSVKLNQAVARAALDWQNFDKYKADAATQEAKVHDKNINLALIVAGRIGAPAVNSLLECLRNEFPLTRLRIAGAEQLAIIGDKKAIGPLVATLSDGGSEKKKREAAMDALQKLTGQDFGHDHGKWEAWWDSTGPAKTSRKPSSLINRTAEITDAAEVYSAINKSDLIEWPSPEMKRLGGEDGWGSFRPKNGDQGAIVAELRHWDTRAKLYILKIGDHYVVIDYRGVKLH
jgi:hypothetical protein